MTDELRQAAEKVIAITEVPNVVDNVQRWYAIEGPAKQLARHYLTDHPADELIDEWWLRSIGFSNKGINGMSKLLPPVNPQAAITELILEWPDWLEDPQKSSPAVWPVTLLQGAPDDAKAPDDHVVLTSVAMRTRCQLRSLLAALGVAL